VDGSDGRVNDEGGGPGGNASGLRSRGYCSHRRDPLTASRDEPTGLSPWWRHAAPTNRFTYFTNSVSGRPSSSARRRSRRRSRQEWGRGAGVARAVPAGRLAVGDARPSTSGWAAEAARPGSQTCRSSCPVAGPARAGRQHPGSGRSSLAWWCRAPLASCCRACVGPCCRPPFLGSSDHPGPESRPASPAPSLRARHPASERPPFPRGSGSSLPLQVTSSSS
jgi:hypothetical protein